MAVLGIRGLVFDCFGVLYVGSLQALYEVTPEERWKDLHDLSIASDYGYMSREDFLEGVAGLTGKSVADIRAIQAKAHVRNDALLAYIKELRANYKIVLLSNVGRELIQSLFTESELSKFFDAKVLSYETGLVKPNPHAYELAAEKVGLAPGECVMIDDLEKNIEGADAAGMKGIVYTNITSLKRDLTTLLNV